MYKLPYSANYDLVKKCLGAVPPWPQRHSNKQRPKVDLNIEVPVRGIQEQTSSWVCIEDVVRYLRQEGLKVWRLNNRDLRCDGQFYAISDKYFSAARLLILANERRKRAGVPLFLVEGVSEF